MRRFSVIALLASWWLFGVPASGGGDGYNGGGWSTPAQSHDYKTAHEESSVHSQVYETSHEGSVPYSHATPTIPMHSECSIVTEVTATKIVTYFSTVTGGTATTVVTIYTTKTLPPVTVTTCSSSTCPANTTITVPSPVCQVGTTSFITTINTFMGNITTECLTCLTGPMCPTLPPNSTVTTTVTTTSYVPIPAPCPSNCSISCGLPTNITCTPTGPVTCKDPVTCKNPVTCSVTGKVDCDVENTIHCSYPTSPINCNCHGRVDCNLPLNGTVNCNLPLNGTVNCNLPPNGTVNCNPSNGTVKCAAVDCSAVKCSAVDCTLPTTPLLCDLKETPTVYCHNDFWKILAILFIILFGLLVIALTAAALIYFWSKRRRCLVCGQHNCTCEGGPTYEYPQPQPPPQPPQPPQPQPPPDRGYGDDGPPERAYDGD